jgi:hypothetical protein
LSLKSWGLKGAAQGEFRVLSIRRNVFGRASVDYSSADYHAQPVPEPSSWSGESWSDNENSQRWVMGLLLSPMLILLAESLFSGTELITPLSRPFLWWMRGLGLVDGIVLSVFLAKSPTYRSGSFRGLIGLLAMPIFMAAAFDALAWRAADWIAFGASTAPYEHVQYPIKDVSAGRKGRRSTIGIDPFGTGERSHIPIPREQYYELRDSDAGQCVTVEQRTAPNGAVEIRTNGSYTLDSPEPAVVSSC